MLYLSQNSIYYSVICKDSLGYTGKNVLYIMKFIFVREFYLLYKLYYYIVSDMLNSKVPGI